MWKFWYVTVKYLIKYSMRTENFISGFQIYYSMMFINNIWICTVFHPRNAISLY